MELSIRLTSRPSPACWPRIVVVIIVIVTVLLIWRLGSGLPAAVTATLAASLAGVPAARALMAGQEGAGTNTGQP